VVGGTGRDLLFGGSGRDSLIGGDGRDRLDGGSGKDAMSGGSGPDTFVFNPGNEEDRVQDFRPSGDAFDVVDMSGFTGIRGFADLKHHYMHQDHDDVVIRVGDDDVLTLIDVTVDKLHAQNFLFA
jgi:Ca2+-binding RTX toxin-like protein